MAYEAVHPETKPGWADAVAERVVKLAALTTASSRKALEKAANRSARFAALPSWPGARAWS